MTTLSDKQKPGLPPPPAPPKRAANPWTLSETARKPEQRPEPIDQQLLEELIPQAPVGEGPAHEAPAHEQAPPPVGPSRARPGWISLVVVGIAALIVMRLFFAARKDGDWVGIIGPLVAIAFIAHGWWRFSQRREAKKSKLE